MSFYLFTALALVCSLLTGYGFAAVASSENQVAQVLHWGNGAEPKDLDPHIVTGVPEHHLLLNLFEPLVAKHPKTLAPIPGVAEKWKISKDGKTYTFTLRKDAKWSDGTPITAQDFVYSWTRLLEPSTAAEYAYQAFYIKNGAAYNRGELKDASKLGIKAVDAHTFQVSLDNPTPFFLGLLNHHSLFPVPKHTIEKFGKNWTRPENMVSNGAFVLADWQMNKVIKIKKNLNYWDKEKVVLNEAHVYPTEVLDTEEKLFRSQQLHVTNEIPLEKIPAWRNDKTGSFQTHPYLGIYFYRINVTKPPLNDKRVRKALNLAVDRTVLTTVVSKGFQDPAQAYTPPNTAGYSPKAVLPKDLSRVDEAKRLLAEAGFPGGKGFPTIEILYNTHEGHKKFAEAVQQMLRTNLGINVTIVNQEWKVYLDSQKTLSYQLSRAGWIGDYNDPNTFLDMWVTGGGQNETGWGNKKYDELIAAAAKELNAKKRLQIFQQAEDILMEELPVIPFYVYKRHYLKSPEVVGWEPNIEDIHPLKYVSLQPRQLAGLKK